MQDSDDSSEHQQQSPPRPKTSKKLTGAATYRTKFNSIWVSHYRVLFEVERSVSLPEHLTSGHTSSTRLCCTYHHFPPQTPVIFNIYSTSRNPQHFADPLSFKPERWSRDESTEVNPFSSLPFGFGPRSCYGEFGEKVAN